MSLFRISMISPGNRFVDYVKLVTRSNIRISGDYFNIEPRPRNNKKGLSQSNHVILNEVKNPLTDIDSAANTNPLLRLE